MFSPEKFVTHENTVSPVFSKPALLNLKISSRHGKKLKKKKKKPVKLIFTIYSLFHSSTVKMLSLQRESICSYHVACVFFARSLDVCVLQT